MSVSPCMDSCDQWKQNPPMPDSMKYCLIGDPYNFSWLTACFCIRLLNRNIYLNCIIEK